MSAKVLAFPPPKVITVQAFRPVRGILTSAFLLGFGIGASIVAWRVRA